MKGTDHSKMKHGIMQHGANPLMDMTGHNHHKMMIADFKKRFYVVLILAIPIIHPIFYSHYQPSYLYMVVGLF